MSPLPADKLRDIVGRFPTVRDEDWKYTDLTRVREISSRWVDEGAAVQPAMLPDLIAEITSAIDADWLVIANGVPGDAAMPNGVAVEKTAGESSPDSALAEFNAALLHEGVTVRFSDVVARPVGILIIDSAEQTSVTQVRVDIDFEPGASGEIIEYHVSRGEADQYTNAFLSLQVGDQATARHVRVQDRAAHHVQTAKTTVSIGKDASFHSASFDLGGGLIRNDLVIDIAKPGAHVAFDGLYLAAAGQHIDNHTHVDHRVGPATSRQEYRGILNGNCRCVWNGKAIVHEGADGTDADQANHNLLLSDKAEIDAKPELEIYTDDVKCSHGTTVGQLDETALFYLRTRGLDEQAATQILTHAFAAGLVSRVAIDAVRESVTVLLDKRLGELAVAGEEIRA